MNISGRQGKKTGWKTTLRWCCLNEVTKKGEPGKTMYSQSHIIVHKIKWNKINHVGIDIYCLHCLQIWVANGLKYDSDSFIRVEQHWHRAWANLIFGTHSFAKFYISRKQRFPFSLFAIRIGFYHFLHKQHADIIIFRIVYNHQQMSTFGSS